MITQLHSGDALSRTQRSIEKSWTLPPKAYTDDAFFRWEMTHLIARNWHCIGRVDHVTKPGDFRSMVVADTPLVLVRDEDNELRVLSNVCRHRAMLVAPESGNCRRFQCPFHGWTYDLQGSLVAASLMERTDGFDKKDWGLKPVRHDVCDGFVFVNLDTSAPDLHTTLGDFSQIHAPWSLDDMVTTRRKRFDVACNWKLFIQVFMEYYHLPVVHRESLAQTRYKPASDESSDTGDFISLFGLHEGSGAVLQQDNHGTFDAIDTLDSHHMSGSRYTQLLPAGALAATRDCMWFYECYPVSANRSVFWMNNCFSQKTAQREDFEDVVASYYTRWDLALAEDIEILERQQIGMSSPMATSGRLSFMESGVANFERWLATRVDDEAAQLLGA